MNTRREGKPAPTGHCIDVQLEPTNEEAAGSWHVTMTRSVWTQDYQEWDVTATADDCSRPNTSAHVLQFWLFQEDGSHVQSVPTESHGYTDLEWAKLDGHILGAFLETTPLLANGSNTFNGRIRYRSPAAVSFRISAQAEDLVPGNDFSPNWQAEGSVAL